MRVIQVYKTKKPSTKMTLKDYFLCVASGTVWAYLIAVNI